jgi:hypothetical protein
MKQVQNLGKAISRDIQKNIKGGDKEMPAGTHCEADCGHTTVEIWCSGACHSEDGSLGWAKCVDGSRAEYCPW